MPSDQDVHIPLEALWAHGKDKTGLSDDQFEHLYQCNRCLYDLGMCHISQTLSKSGDYNAAGAAEDEWIST